MKILHIDIETAPNTAHVWGLFKQNIGINQLMDSSYVLCFAAKWHGKKDIIFDSVYKSKHSTMVKKAWKLLDEADAVVHYNGKRFDIPTLNKEFLKAGLLPPSGYHQIDLLKIIKDRFRFPSNKLDYVAQALGIGKKVKHIGHELWVKCMAGDKASWKEMEEYNKQDTLLLEDVYLRLLPWIKNHPNHALYTNDNVTVCPNCGSGHIVKNGVETTQTMTYQRFRCVDCGTPLRGRFNILDKAKKKSILTGSKV